MRVLIVKTSSMGDVIHALPMASDISRAFPHARIDWIVEEAFADIPHLHPGVTRVLTVALRRWRRRPLLQRHWRELAQARAALRQTRYHAVIDCQGLLKSALLAWSARGPASGYAARCAREPLAALFYRHRFDIDPALHAVERNRRLAAAALGYALHELPEDFGVRQRVGQLHAQAPFDARGDVLLFTNASRPGKLWPDGNWSALEQSFAAEGRRSLLAWGTPAEYLACRERAAHMRNALVLPRANIAQLATLAAHAAVVVGLDTGLTHLAAAVGAPTVGLFCDYDPALVGLRGAGAVQSLGGVGQAPTVDAVLAAVARVRGGAGAGGG